MCIRDRPTPTVAPTATPTPTPTVAPTATPTPTPTVAPTATPEPAKYLLSYNANGGSGSQLPGAVEAEAGASIQVDLSVQPVRAGYLFLGWDEDPASSSARYPAEGAASLVMPEQDLTLYAVWKIDETQTASAGYTVHYYIDGALQPDWTETYSKTTLVADNPAPAYVVKQVTDHLAGLGADYYAASRPDLPVTLSGEDNVLEVHYAHKLVDVAGTGIELSHNYVYTRVIDGQTDVNNFSAVSGFSGAQPGSLLRLQDLQQTVDPEGNTGYQPTGAAITRTRLPLIAPEMEHEVQAPETSAGQTADAAAASLAQAQMARDAAQQDKALADEALIAAQNSLEAARTALAEAEDAAIPAAQQLQELAAREEPLSEEELALQAQLQGAVEALAAAQAAVTQAEALAAQRAEEAQAAANALIEAENSLAQAQEAASGAQQALAAVQAAALNAAAQTLAVGESETVALDADGAFLYEAGYTYQVRLDYAKTYVYQTPAEPEQEIVSPGPSAPVQPAPGLPVVSPAEPSAPQAAAPAVAAPPAAGTVSISDDDVPLGATAGLRGKSRVRRGTYVILDDSAPLGALPKTSGSLDASWGALGAFLLAAGAALGLKGKRKEQQ